MNYEYMGRAKSEEMFDIFDQRIDKIPLSNVESIYEDNQGKKAMPEFIICSNRQVLKLRKKQKILQYHDVLEGSADFKRNKVMLFLPLKPGYELSGEVIGMKSKNKSYNKCTNIYIFILDQLFYSREDGEGPVDGDDRRLSTVEQNER